MQRRTSFRSDSLKSVLTDDVGSNGIGGTYYESVPVLQSFYDECRLILNLAVPSLVAQLGWSVPSTLIASYIGRNFGPIYLGGYMLVMLSCSLCTLSLLEGVFSAIDSKMPQAFGMKKYIELQYLSIRGVIVCLLMLIPFIIIMSLYMDQILIAVGEDDDASAAAVQWFRVYAFSLPFYSVFHTAATFLGSQSILMPEVIAVLVNSLLVLPILLYGLGHYFGFIGTAYAMTLYEAIQMIFLLTYCSYYPQHHPETWTPLTIQHFKAAIKRKPFQRFAWLSVGGILATSDWIYWELLSMMIGTMGVTQLSVHTIPTQVSSVVYMFQLGLAIALSIRVGNLIVQSPNDARKLSFYTAIGCHFIFAIFSTYIYLYRHFIYSLFTKDDDVIAGCEEIWWLVTVFTFNMGSFTVVDGIIEGLGKQWIVGHLTVVFLFLLGLPAFCYFGIYKEGGVYAAWEAMLYPNVALNIATIIYLFYVDWEQISADINEEGDSDSEDNYTDDDESNDDERSNARKSAHEHVIKTIKYTTTTTNHDEETIPLAAAGSIGSIDDDNDYATYYGSTDDNDNNNNNTNQHNGFQNDNKTTNGVLMNGYSATKNHDDSPIE